MRLARFLLPFAALISLAACSKPEDAATSRSATPEPPIIEQTAVAPDVAADIEVIVIEPGLSMRILREGSGAVAQVGNTAVVHYTGWLFDPAAANNRGNKFDSSLDRNQHFEFPLGGGRVIRGWDRGVVGMKIGEKRELTIAPELAYGDRDLGIIPPGSTLVFEVDLDDLRVPDSAAE